MIGNDIVDLADPRAAGKSRDLRFMDRVFTAKERQAIFNHVNRDLYLWSLWAGKETAYKALCKIYSALSSAPGRYEIELFPSAGPVPERGVARTPCGSVSLRLFTGRDHLHCIGVTAGHDTDSVMWDVARIDRGNADPGYQSEIVRNMIKRAASCYLKESPETMEIVRIRGPRGLGPPVLYVRKAQTTLDISMSHDGRFVACALQDIRGKSTTPQDAPAGNNVTVGVGGSRQ